MVCSIPTHKSFKLTCRSRASFHIVRCTCLLNIPSSCTLRVGNAILKLPRIRDYPHDILDVKPINVRDVQVLAKRLSTSHFDLHNPTSLQHSSLHKGAVQMALCMPRSCHAYRYLSQIASLSCKIWGLRETSDNSTWYLRAF